MLQIFDGNVDEYIRVVRDTYKLSRTVQLSGLISQTSGFRHLQAEKKINKVESMQQIQNKRNVILL